MCDSKKPFVGFRTCNFYGKKTGKCFDKDDMRNLRRKRKLEKFEKYVASKKPADVVSLNIYNYNKNGSECVGNITSHSKTNMVFSKQNDAIRFSQDKVSKVVLSPFGVSLGYVFTGSLRAPTYYVVL